MSFDPDRSVCVVIAAYQAADTIAEAVHSALREPQVAEVVVVDDHSFDDTCARASAADDGSGRLRVIGLDENGGPAQARNIAIETTQAPFISILDADDLFLPGRFEALLNGTDWDLAADNIAFADAAAARYFRSQAGVDPEPWFLDLVGFVDGNISRRGKQRGEIGFLKPVMRRSFLDRHGLRYNEALRLGEDYDLYARALASGARYKVIRTCGYVAVVRGESLSGSHRTEDLRALYEADSAILSETPLGPAERAAILRHQRHVRARYDLRHFLDAKKESGIVAATVGALGRPASLFGIAAGIAADKFDAVHAKWPARTRGTDTAPSSPRFLFPAEKQN